MEAIMQNRFEGSIFFVYDRHFLQKEEDRLEDAIMYFYPHSMPVDNQCRLCGQLMGVVQFAETIFDSYPVLFRFGNEKIAVKHVGKYSFALAGSSVEPDSALLATVDRLYFLFSFYHGSIHQVELECDNDKEKFLPEIRVIWEQYLAFIRNYGDNLPSVFNPVPYLPLKNDPNFYFLKASHILESCQRRTQIIAGSILYNRYILCSQLTDSISRCLLLLKPNQHNHPAVPIETDYQLPFGVRLFNVYLNRNELKEILENNDNSPYHSHNETLSSLHCCCTGHRTPRRTPRATPCTMFLEPEPVVNVEEALTQSEKDPLCSSDNSGPKLCKAMLEDLILKGFKCCKCVDDEEGELDDASFDTSVESVIEVMEEKMKQKNGFLYSTENIERDGIPENEGRDTFSRNSARSQNSVRTVETESGIEVTGSDFHSSAATHFDQRSASLRDASYLEKCRNFGGDFEQRKAGQCSVSSNQVRKDTERLLEGNKNFGSEAARNEEKSDCNEIDEETVKQKHGHCTLNESVGGTLFDSQTVDEINEVKKRTKELSKKSDHVLHNADVHSTGGKDTEQLGESNVILDESEVPDKDSKEVRGISHKIYNQYLDVTSVVEDDEQLYQSSEDSYRTPDEILDTDYPLRDDDGLNGIHNSSEESSEINGDQLGLEGTDDLLDESVIHVCKLRKKHDAERGSLGSGKEGNDDVKCSKDEFESGKASNRHTNCCEVDGLLHANLFVQAHSEIVLILLAKCDLYQNEEAVRSLWSTSLSQLGELDMLMKNCAKDDYQDSQVPFNLLIYDNFEKTMSGNLREPVYSQDHVFCETAKTVHNHFNNAPQLCDVTLRNFLSGIYGERTLSREAYFQEGASVASLSDRHVTPSISGYLERRMRECIVKDHGLPFV